MRIAVDITPLLTKHQYRGIGKYTKNFIQSLKEYDKTNDYFQVVLAKQRKFDCDLLLIPYFSLFEFSLPFIKKVKTLVTVHDLIPKKFSAHFPVGIKGELVWHIQKFLLSRIEGVIVDSEVSRKDVVDICGIKEDKVFVVYPSVGKIFNKISDYFLIRQIRRKYNLPDNFILYVGDCNWNKNVVSLVKACFELKLNLVLVGKIFTDKNISFDHPWNKSLKEVNQLTANSVLVKKIGFVDDRDLAVIYNLARLYVQPSYYEGFGLTMVEAFACGCPVIASNQGSLKEVGGDAPLYFDPYKKGDLTQKIKNIYENKKVLQQLAERGLVQVQRYSGANFAAKMKMIYEKFFKS